MESLEDLIYENYHDYTRYVQENRGDLLQKHEKPDPEKVEKYRVIWETTYILLMEEIGGQEGLRRHLRGHKRSDRRIKRRVS